MSIVRIVVGILEENCYIVTIGKYSLIIDPGDEEERILEACKDLDVREVLVTHHHPDHIGALDSICKHFNLKENVPSGLFNYEVIKTPGHTKDSISFYFKDFNTIFTGDFIFKGTIGRMDLPTGSRKDMINSLNKMKNYPIDANIYPGHGDKTILKNEKELWKYI